MQTNRYIPGPEAPTSRFGDVLKHLGEFLEVSYGFGTSGALLKHLGVIVGCLGGVLWRFGSF